MSDLGIRGSTKDILKASVREFAKSIYTIKEICESNPNILSILVMSNNRKIFEKAIKVGELIKQSPICDKELIMLSDMLIDQNKELLEMYDKHKEKLNEKTNKENKKDYKDLEQIKEEVVEQDDKNDKEQDEEFILKNSWEISPEKKQEIQINSSKIAEEHSES